jgi:hypothetical protein
VIAHELLRESPGRKADSVTSLRAGKWGDIYSSIVANEKNLHQYIPKGDRSQVTLTQLRMGAQFDGRHRRDRRLILVLAIIARRKMRHVRQGGIAQKPPRNQHLTQEATTTFAEPTSHDVTHITQARAHGWAFLRTRNPR